MIIACIFWVTKTDNCTAYDKTFVWVSVHTIDHCLPSHLNTVFRALIMSRLLYALPVWSGFLSVELIWQINLLLKRAYQYGFSTTKHTIENMANETDKTLFDKIQNKQHCT